MDFHNNNDENWLGYLISMSLLLLALLVLAAMLSSAKPDDFCQGWDVGYQEGWCYDEQQPEFCVAPVSPVCPIPEVGRDRYEDGYNRGFIKGREDKE